jgi:hypothetical protein
LKNTASNIAAIFFFARCFKTYQAAVELLRLGFWQDAAVLGRVLREGDYQISWVVKGGDDAGQLFLKDHERNLRKVMRELAEHGERTIRTQAQAVVKSTEPDGALDEWWRNWWSKERKENIGWMARKLAYEAHRWEYATLSAFVHSSPALLDHYLSSGTDGAGITVDSRPGISGTNRKFVNVVVFGIFAAFVDTCTAFAKQMDFEFEEELVEISKRIKEQFAE